jgi:hypothetical protein
LALAVGFAILLNVLLLATFVWVELVDPRQLRLAWLAAGLVWIGSAVVSAWHGRGLAPRRASTAEAMFREALGEYLRENWFEAERLLGRLLHLQPRDVEAGLLLATLLRHTKRYHEAIDQLDRLELVADAGRWNREIQAERLWIAQAQAEAVEPVPPIDNPFPGASQQAA